MVNVLTSSVVDHWWCVCSPRVWYIIGGVMVRVLTSSVVYHWWCNGSCASRSLVV